MHGLLKQLMSVNGYWDEQGADGGAGGGGSEDPGVTEVSVNELAAEPTNTDQPTETTAAETVAETPSESSEARTADPVAKRYSDLTKQLRESQEVNRRSQEQLDAALKALDRVTGTVAKPVEEARKPEIDPEPTPPEFVDVEQYQRDMAEYVKQVTARNVKLSLKAAEADRQREQIEAAAESARKAHGEAWNARRQAAMEKYDDYVEVAESPQVAISAAMALTITSLDHGGEVAYYLGKHPEEALKISKLAPVMQAVELGKLEVKVMTPAKPRVSNAADPIRPLTGNGTPQVRADEDLSMEEYAAKRNKR